MPEIDRQRLAQRALTRAQDAGADYADIRINRYRYEFILTREEKVQLVTDEASFGFGIRVLCRGAWGFAASSDVTPAAIDTAALEAVEMARANAALQSEPVELAPVDAHQDNWSTPMKVDPFSVPLKDKIELLLAVNRAALEEPQAKFCASYFYNAHEDKLFASTIGSVIEQQITRLWPHFVVTAVSADGSDYQTREALSQPVGIGYEYLTEYPLLDDARQAGRDAAEKLASPFIEPGIRDVVLDPTNLWLVIHESIGHATELDRALGFEANYAGTSFATPDLLGKLQYGSPIVNVVGDRTEPRGLATVGYDDEGVPAMRFDIIKDGVFVGYQTSREQARWVGDTASHACAYADSYASVPMQRMPNVCLLPGTQPLAPDDLIAGVDDGILVKGRGSWSIDQQRRNFQFGGQLFYRIKNGRIAGMLRDVAYQSNTVDFWNACDAICSAEHYVLGGTYRCGKAEPGQTAPASHGCAPARFRNVNVISTRER